MNDPTLDAGIPVLTEIITAPSPSRSVLPVSGTGSHTAPGTYQFATTDEDDARRWDDMEREIRERVLQQVLERVDFVLEQRVRDTLADVLQTAVQDLAEQIRAGLHYTLKDIVTRSLSQEIAKVRNSKK